MNLYIFKYNNYYNRIVKYEENLANYGTYIHALIDCRDFNPNDGVNTIHVFGSAANNYDGSGDYLIVTDEYDNIISRWFIIETNFTRAGQWNLTLRRDLIVDYYDTIVNAPCFIEKATLTYNDPLVFNEENFTVNQIKTSETLIKDKSGCPWLVGYYAKNATEMNGTVPINSNVDIPYIQIDTPIESWEFYQYNAGNPFRTNIVSGDYKLFTKYYGTSSPKAEFRIAINSGECYDSYTDYNHNTSLELSGPSSADITNVRRVLTSTIKNFGVELLKQHATTYITYNSNLNELLSFQGSIVRDSDGGFYTISIIPTDNITQTAKITAGSLFNDFSNITSASGLFSNPSLNTNSLELSITTQQYIVSVQENIEIETVYNLNNAKLLTIDAPWNIFAIPYGDVVIKNELGETLLTTNKDIGIAAAMGIQSEQQSKVHDIQLLPYCPIQELITDDGEITITSEKQYSYIINNANQSNIGIIFNVPRSNFTFDITDVSVPQASSVIERKVNNECDKWRLTSPNYNNYFDFSVEKNNGVQYFNVDCNYKPFTPYIHINPNFGGLYGKDFNDPRGLILGGDFSLSQIIDQWEQYEIQNKNYQLTFDRQIQNMEVQQKIARTQDIWSMIAGTGQGAAAGGLTGSLLGSSPIGAGIGGVISLAGGLADLSINEQLRNEALDYTRDMFGYQLGNIQALPQTISKVSAFNNNNKIFPVLEYYTCTNREKEALANKIAWNGMTVGVIGTIENYIGNTWTYNGIESKGYIKGQIIRIEDLEDEFHLLKEISNEIYKGVYF